MTVKIALVAPIPRASLSTTTVVNPGLLPNTRRAYLMSRARVSSTLTPQDWRHSSLI